MSKPIKVRFVKPGAKPPPQKKLTYEEVGLRHEMSQFYWLKATFEELFGRPMYMELKENTDLADWKNASNKLLDAIRFSIRSSVHTADDEWFASIEDAIQRGRDHIKLARTASDLFASLSATLIHIVFTQIGFMPTRGSREKTVPLTKEYWEFDRFRSVQYVQTKEQKEALAGYMAYLEKQSTGE